MHLCAFMHSQGSRKTGKRILIIDAHPDPESLSSSIARASWEALGEKSELLELRKLQFELSLKNGYRKPTEMEEDLRKAQRLITEADHIIIATPVWWGSVPALLKGFLDRTLLPGFGFKYRKGSPLWDKLLAGRSAQLYVTMDSPYWWFRFVYGNPAINMLKRTVLEFCGIKPVRVRVFDQVRSSNPEKRKRWLDLVKKESMRWN
tara:strand:- start:6614 stop:7228 length:615 start_codon:yes stop_codon:yes gene_type:complete